MTRLATTTPGAHGQGVHLPGLQRLSWALLVAAVLAYFCLSSHALLVLGIPYDVPQGAFPSKIHPGTYLLLAAWVAGLGAQGNPLATATRQALQQPMLFAAMLGMAGVFVWAVMQHGPSGLAFIIDSLVMPCIAALTVLLQPRYRQRQLLLVLMGLLLLNSLLAIAEFALRTRLIPLFPLAERAQEAYFRSSALLGHPLANSQVVLALMPALLLMPWHPAWRLLALVLVGLGLLTFGSRAALAALLLYVLLAALPQVARMLRGQFNYTQVTGGLLGAALGASALVGVVAVTGLGERIFKNLTWDNSASVRVRSWDVLDYLNGSDLWFGVSIPRIDTIAARVGIDMRYEAIENFWLYLLLLLGVVGFTLFVVALSLLLLHLWRRAGAQLRVAMVMYLVIASGSNTLSSKTVSLLLLTVAVQCAAAIRQPASPSVMHPHGTWPGRVQASGVRR